MNSALGLLLVIVLAWFGLKLIARIALAALAVLVVGVVFFGLDIGELGAVTQFSRLSR